MSDATEERYGEGDVTPADDLLTLHPDGTATIHRVGENVTVENGGGDGE